MSRIGKKPINIPENVKVTVDGNHVTITGNKGKLGFDVHPDIIVKKDNGKIVVTRPSDTKSHRALHGTTRAILANMIEGITAGFKKELEINGVGYSAILERNRLKLLLGFSHDIYFDPPEGIRIVAKRSNITVSGIDKQLVGEVAAKIRSFRPPEPYKGKGIRYRGEFIRIKKGKTVGG
ncbi:MAG: 50S ribosomal protein L6 [Candidatus Marinimicrobia bacterium]|nr:50S ribosomal protein L6 [Candidatus Neomarinimicrobiota bacterium]